LGEGERGREDGLRLALARAEGGGEEAEEGVVEGGRGGGRGVAFPLALEPDAPFLQAAEGGKGGREGGREGGRNG